MIRILVLVAALLVSSPCSAAGQWSLGFRNRARVVRQWRLGAKYRKVERSRTVQRPVLLNLLPRKVRAAQTCTNCTSE